MPNPLRRNSTPTTRTAALIAAFAGVCLALAVIGAAAAQPLGGLLGDSVEGRRFSFVGWELETAFNRLLTVAAESIGIGGPDGGRAELDAFLAEPSEGLENPAERALERLLARAISEAGLDSPLPLFGRQRIVWPPVDVEFSPPPRILAVSPRTEIDYTAGVLLEPGVEPGEYAEIEARIEAGGEWSAWIGGVGGVALYPAIVRPLRDPLSMLQLAAHEWVHHYLAFHPLGLRYGLSEELRALNETVADIAGDELGASVAGDRAPAADDAAAEAEREHFYRTMRQLRLDVDELLAAGEIAAAEALMERRRVELNAEGWNIRRINQAFFAFRGGYADSPDSVNPIGAELLALRAASPTLAAFMARVRGFTGRDDLRAALE